MPWAIWVALAAVTSTMIGAQWDIAWHRSIGRDGFWSPPHVAIYLGAVLAGLAAGWLILSTTFSQTATAARAVSVRVWGFRGPLGAFVAAWGGVAMLASAPFDDWWHNTYGLDVRILSPPHTLLALGIFAMALGALMLIGGWSNRAPERTLPKYFFLYIAGLILILIMTFSMEYTSRAGLHSIRPYRVIAAGAPLMLLGAGRASGARWGATWVAGVYSFMYLALLWIFPLVPAVPKLGPVYYPVTHLVPAGFPLLLIAPAIVLDVIAPKLEARPRWQRAIVFGLIFLAVFMAVEWPFASFLNSAAADNWIFGGAYHDYNTRPNWAEMQHRFFFYEHSTGQRALEVGLAIFSACAMSWIALAWGDSMRKLRR